MASQAPLVIKDHLDTNVTFSPNGSRVTAPGKTTAIWKDRSAATAVGYCTIVETHADANSNGIEKFRYTLTLPTTVTDPTSGSVKVSHFVSATVEVFIPTQATAGEIGRLQKMTANLVNSPYMGNALVNRESAW